MLEEQMIIFGKRLKQERNLLQWTQEHLAKQIGGSTASIDRWENGRGTPRGDALKELTRVFGRPPEHWGTCKWWSVPYQRNLYFTGRESILQRLHNDLVANKSANSAKIRALIGMGGIGKTQIAIEFLYRYAHEYDAILWIHAGSRDTMNTDVLSLAKTLDLPDKENLSPFQAAKALKNWLQNHDRWLLIIDNVDTLSMDFMVLPQRYTGVVLLTTRSREADLYIKSIEVEKMSHSESTAFLQKHISTNEDEESEKNLSILERKALLTLWEMMEGLPLALDQAGAYIKTAPCSLPEYVRLYRQHRKALLEDRVSHTPEHPEAVATTWNVSFEHIRRKTPAAAELLRLFAFLSPDNIPETLLVWGKTHCTPQLLKLAASDKLLKDAIQSLYKYSLVQRNSTTQMLQIHRLVQAVLIDAMPEEVRREWKVRTIRILNEAFPKAPFQEWERCGQLLSHVQTCAIDIENEAEPVQREATDVIDRAGSYLREQGQYVEAESLLKLALSIRKKYLNADDPAIATSLSNLAGLYFYQDKYQQATDLIEAAFAIRKQRLGDEHPTTTESMKHLALLHLRQEQYDQAKPLFKQSLSLSERLMGYDNPNTANKMSNLALLYLAQEQYGKAEALLKSAFFINKRCLGAEHPETARTVENLAFVYMKQGRSWRAEPLLYQALCLHAQLSGLESPDFAYPLYGLAELYRVQKKYKQSESLHQQAFSIRQQCLGKKHLDTAESLLGLADLYTDCARYEEAAPLYVQVLAIREKILGWESPSIVKARQAYAALQQMANMEQDKKQ